ncbi:uncharacterized protein [Anoplolepis gracilipes]|uniref:uncharacterized protein n=1 Tax=Anoplolepis gracilipes TaxID=354296 RepID=UPI003BA041A6
MKVLQCNLNNSRRAYDILTQHIIEMGVTICAISEPVQNLYPPNWFVSMDGRSAILWRLDKSFGSCRLVSRKEQLVVVSVGDLYFLSCYISLNSNREASNKMMEEIIRQLGNRVVICGDFNAKSPLWGSLYTNYRGSLLEDLAAELDLRILNNGAEPTCVRPQGVSIIDLTWVTPGLLGRVENWRVCSKIESLSDHQYVFFTVHQQPVRNQNPEVKRNNRWKWDKLDNDRFQVALIWSAADEPPEDRNGPETAAEWLSRSLVDACDASAPSVHRPTRKRQGLLVERSSGGTTDQDHQI